MTVKPTSPPLPKAVRRDLVARFGERFSADAQVRRQHCQTLGYIAGQPPSSVVFAQSQEDVEFLLLICSAYTVPVIPFGAGTSLEGQVNAPYGGIALDVSGMHRVIRLLEEDMLAVVQPGVTRPQINRRLKRHGLFFSVDPGADATLGGMASTRASGTNAVGYGTMRENVATLRVVTPTGQSASLGTVAPKSAAGYDLCHLFIGAEGTLGVITELTVRLHAQPATASVGLCPFPSIAAAVQAVVTAHKNGIRPVRLELLDVPSVQAVNAYSSLGIPELPHLFTEMHGSRLAVSEGISSLTEIFRAAGGYQPQFSSSPSGRESLWRARHDAWWALHAARPGRRGMATDVCVPVSLLSKCVEETNADLQFLGLDAPLIGHVGDGNFHLLIFADWSDKAAVGEVEKFVGRMNERAIRMGGTCTGEHGVGQGKSAFMDLEHGSAVGIMQAVKTALDPKGIMNPGKIFTTNPPAGTAERIRLAT